MFYTCKPGEELIIERFGKYHRTLAQAGMGLKLPFDRVAARVSTGIRQQQVNLPFMTQDKLFIGMEVLLSMRVTDAQKYHYNRQQTEKLIDRHFTAEMRQEISALTLEQALDCRAALERVLASTAQKLGADCGVELVSVSQKSVNLAADGKEILAAAGVSQRTSVDKVRDAADAVSAIQQGLGGDVTVRKPLVLKKPGGA